MPFQVAFDPTSEIVQGAASGQRQLTTFRHRNSTSLGAWTMRRNRILTGCDWPSLEVLHPLAVSFRARHTGKSVPDDLFTKDDWKTMQNAEGRAPQWLELIPSMVGGLKNWQREMRSDETRKMCFSIWLVGWTTSCCCLIGLGRTEPWAE